MNTKINRVIFHVGLPKTGTTSIQSTLLKNSSKLSENGILYPACWGAQQVAILGNLFSDEPENLINNIRFNLTREQIIKRNLQNINELYQEVQNTNCTTILFSSEIISNFTEKEIFNLKQFCLESFPMASLEIFVFIRNNIDHSASKCQHRLRIGETTIDRFTINEKDYFKRYLQKFINQFDKRKIKIIQFEEAIMHEYGLVGHFISSLGIERTVLSQLDFVRVNESISMKSAEIISYINSKLPLFSFSSNSKKSFEHPLTKGRFESDVYPLFSISGEKFLLSKEKVQNIITNSQEDADWLYDQFGIKYNINIDNYKFSEHQSYDQQYFDEISSIYEKVSDVIKKLIYDFLQQVETKTRQDQKTIDLLIKWIETNYAYIPKTPLQTLRSQVDLHCKKDENNKKWLLERIGNNSRIADFNRLMSIFLANHEQYEAALYFIERARFYNPTSQHLIKKAEEYTQKLKLK